MRVVDEAAARDVDAEAGTTRTRSRWRPAALAAAAVGVAAVALVSTTVLSQPVTPAPAGTTALPAAGVGPASDVAALQERLRRVPGDWNAWSALGNAYLAEAQVTADPTFYGRAEDAYAQSLAVRPEENAAALTGQGALAASRHDFAAALELGRRAQEINPYSSTTQGVLVDALVELGQYDAAAVELQRMVDLRPDVASFTRVSYLRELSGDLEGARAALEQAARFAFAPSDSAAVQQYLGELSFAEGSLDQALSHYEAGLQHTPDSPRLLAGRAQVAAAAGDVEAALADYSVAAQRMPEPGVLVRYAELLEAAGRPDEAAEQHAVIEAVERLYRENGANPDLELALHAADVGAADEALRIAQREWDVRRSVHVLDAYAWALHVNGRSAEALQHARAADDMGGTNALFAYHRGMIERSLGMEAEAEASLARALELNPHFSPRHAPLARAALADLRAPG